MKLRFLPILLLLAVPAFADTFGSDANTFTMDFVTIGNAVNAPDDTGYGRVDYIYQMGVNEVSRGMINAYNALIPEHGGPTLTMSDMTPFGGNGANRPATGVSWNEAARFVNWLNTSEGYSAAYKFTTGGANDNIALWTNLDTGYDPNKSGGAGYWNYATGSDSAPTAIASGTTSGTAVYGQSVATGPADITNAGGLSAYGTMAQNGNVREWGESAIDGGNDSAGESRVVRGGSWFNSSGSLASSARGLTSPTSEFDLVGFRVAAVPEPSGVLLTLIGMMGVVLRRKR